MRVYLESRGGGTFALEKIRAVEILAESSPNNEPDIRGGARFFEDDLKLIAAGLDRHRTLATKGSVHHCLCIESSRGLINVVMELSDKSASNPVETDGCNPSN